MPDIDSIRLPSREVRSTGFDNHQTPSPRASSSSLAQAAAINASFQHEDSRRSSTTSIRGRPSPQFSHSERRRSSAYLASHDPSLPGPGEFQSSDRPGVNLPYRTASPQGLGSPLIGPRFRDRAPSLGELHQELEQEQEAQVNRLLEQIRQQQAQIDNLRSAQYTPLSGSTVEAITPPSERASYTSNLGGNYQAPPDLHPHYIPIMSASSRPHSPTPRSSVELSRQSSHRSRAVSGTRSPSLRPTSAGLQSQDDGWSGERLSRLDDSAYYQAATQNLTRDNQMLRRRIQELERQLSEANPATTNNPSTTSNLASAPPLDAANEENPD